MQVLQQKAPAKVIKRASCNEVFLNLRTYIELSHYFDAILFWTSIRRNLVDALTAL